MKSVIPVAINATTSQAPDGSLAFESAQYTDAQLQANPALLQTTLAGDVIPPRWRTDPRYQIDAGAGTVATGTGV